MPKLNIEQGKYCSTARAPCAKNIFTVSYHQNEVGIRSLALQHEPQIGHGFEIGVTGAELRRLAVKGQTGGSYRSSTFVPSFEGQSS